jgi:NAD(P) transhydrogenase subunit beta
VLFILSLGGLSGQESAKRAVWYGIVGMALAVVATLIGPGSGLAAMSLILIAAGAAVGYQLATRVQMTQMPELVAIMHSACRPGRRLRGLQRPCRDRPRGGRFHGGGLPFPQPEAAERRRPTRFWARCRTSRN